MAGYFGTRAQQTLQARVDEMSGWISSTPGACNSGRSLGCDDLDKFGWRNVEEIMSRDGVLGFRLLLSQRAGELVAWMTSRGYRIDFWDPFVGDRGNVLRAADAILAKPLPSDVKIGPDPTEPTGDYIEAIQALMSESGVSPYSGSMLSGRQAPAITAVLLDQSGTAIAVAFGHRPHNVHSRFSDYAYGGAVAVSPVHRGRGFGRYVNALVAARTLRELGGTHFYEFVSADNAWSRRMVEACALRPCPELFAAMAVAGNEKFTR